MKRNDYGYGISEDFGKNVKWVAIVDKKIVIKGNSEEEVRREVERKYPGKEFSIFEVPVDAPVVF